MADRELVVLGTSSAVPTRTRAHPGLVLRWSGLGVLVDPGEGTQRQLQLAGVAASAVQVVWITHGHADHYLGLPGFLLRRRMDGLEEPVHLVHPAAADDVVDGLLRVSGDEGVVRHRVGATGDVLRAGDAVLRAVALDHRVPAFGLRLQEDDGVRVRADRAAALGVSGPAVGALLREGALRVGDRLVRAEEVTEPRPGQAAAVVMDTRLCPGAEELADRADLLVTESTFLDADAELATAYAHLTAGQAGRLAAAAGARRLVLQHYSQRYPDERAFAAEASRWHADVVAAVDLDVVPVPRRGTPGAAGR